MTSRSLAFLSTFALLTALLAAPPTPSAAQEAPDTPTRTLDAGDRPANRARPGDALGVVAPGAEVTARLNVPAPRTDLNPRELLAWRTARALDGEVVTAGADDLRDILAASPGATVERVPVLQELSVVSEGSEVIDAPQWQSAGLGGRGVKVAIVDSSFDGYLSLLGSELPASVTTRSFHIGGPMEIGSEHGTGVAEIVFDLAPQATFYLVAVNLVDDLDPVVDYLIAQGVDVVNMSLGSTTGPFGPQSAARQAVQRAVAAGIVWVNAGGNSGDGHWGGNFVDLDGDGWGEISGTVEINTLMVPPQGTVFVDLSWVDAGTDLDLCFYEFIGSTPYEVGCSSSAQSFGLPPIESVIWFNDYLYLPVEYGYAVTKFSGSPGYYDVFIQGDYYDLGYLEPAGSMLTPGDAPAAITVGASSWMDPATVVSYSSRGPTVDGYTKPDLIAPTDVSTSAFGLYNFGGTSSASPHVAGLAALYLDANPGASPAQVKRALTDRSSFVGYGSRPNNTVGYGLAMTGSVPQGDPADWSAELVGDFDGDGNDDFAAYDETTGFWWVSHSTGTKFNPQRWAINSEKAGWAPQMVGDFTGDGKDDIVSYHQASGTWWVNRSTGTSFVMEKWATFSTRTGWSPQMVGDFTGDGKADVVSYHQASGTWWVNRSTGTGFVLQKWATFSTRTGWAPQLVGDFDGNGKDDIVSYHQASGTWWVNVSTGSSFTLRKWATFSTRTGWAPQLIGDFTGDGKDDVVSYHEKSGTWWVNRSTGSGFTLRKWATFSTSTGWAPQLIGDFTGDGKDDVVSYHQASGTWWVNRSNGSSFTLQKWATFSTKTGWNPQVIGDFTGDRKDDVLNHHATAETWYVNESTGTTFTLRRWHP